VKLRDKWKRKKETRSGADSFSLLAYLSSPTDGRTLRGREGGRGEGSLKASTPTPTPQTFFLSMNLGRAKMEMGGRKKKRGRGR